MSWPDLTRTATAVDHYDATREDYLANKASWTDLAKAERRVKEAFAYDTADRNQHETALRVAPRDPWLRQLLARWAEASS